MVRGSNPRLPLTEFARRTGLVAGIALLTAAFAAFLWSVSRALLVLFAAILFAVMLDGLTRSLMRRVRMPRGVALTAVILALAAIVVGIFLLGGMRIASQAPVLQRNMEHSVEQIQHQLQDMGFNLGELNMRSASQGKLPGLSGLFSNVGSYLSTSVEMVTNVLIIIVAGIYFAASPHFYVNTVVMLVSRRRRARLRAVGREAAHALRRWLIGRFLAMLSVGLLTGVGLALLQVKLAGLLAVIACLLTFIPYLGTIISLIPAVLLSILNTPVTAVYVVMLYLAAHTFEGYVLSPLIQRQTVHVAPGWLILSQLVGALAAGLFGILIAAPLLVAITILVQMLYVEDVLGDNVRILGE